MFDFIAGPLGQFLNFIYQNVALKNYGLAIIIFTIVIKFILLPLTIKQTNSSMKMQEIQPRMKELQKKYKNDRETLNQEMMKLYQENNFNPAGGCLPMLVQMPIILSLFWVVSRPLKYMLNISESTREILAEALNLSVSNRYVETNIINHLTSEVGSKVISENNIDPTLVAEILDMQGGMNFFGINLSLVPTWNIGEILGNPNIYVPLLLIPIFATITTFISTQMIMPKSTGNTDNSMQRNMMFITPIMTLVFSFQFPAALGLYWIVGYVFQIFQQLFINKYLKKKKEVAVE